ncbi:hypothetical protein ACKKBG_A17120 [Auxenochlorella protothecoides x Auxenochlorella symbiontica]
MVEAGVQAELESLRARLAQSELDKAALQSDVEMLCLQTTSNTTFNSSSVLQERIRYTDKELSSCRAALAASQAQASSLGEDLRALKAAHRDTGARLRDALDRSALLDRELAFYQTSSARAVADRDRTAYEAEGLRERTLALETRLEDAEGHAATQGAARLAAEEREAVLRAEVARLEALAAEAAKLPGLREELAAALRREAALERRLARAGEEAEDLRGRLEEAARAAAGAAAAYKRQGAELEAERDTKRGAQAELESARRQLAGLEAELAAAAASREAADAALVRRDKEAVALEAGAAEARSSLEEVAAQKVSALLRLSEAEGLLARYKERVASLAASLEATRRDAAAGAPSGNDSAHSSPSKPATSPAKGRAVPGGGWWGRSNSLEP